MAEMTAPKLKRYLWIGHRAPGSELWLHSATAETMEEAEALIDRLREAYRLLSPVEYLTAGYRITVEYGRA